MELASRMAVELLSQKLPILSFRFIKYCATMAVAVYARLCINLGAYLILLSYSPQTIVAFRNQQTAFAAARESIAGSPFSGMFYFKEPLKFTNPCTYPSPYPDRTAFERQCNLPIDQIRHYLICDAGNSFSVTEAEVLASQLDGLVLDRLDKQAREELPGSRCVCPRDNSNGPNWQRRTEQYCWYNFAFAFLQSLDLPKYQLPPNIRSEEMCRIIASNESTTRPARFSTATTPKRTNWTATKVAAYGQTFARLLRERWRVGNCGEDILVLIIKRRPLQLARSKVQDRIQHPIIYVSYGTEALDRTNAYDPHDLRDLIRDTNERLDEGFPLQQVLKRFLRSQSILLDHADAIRYKPKNRNYVPPWALIVFGVCGGLLLVMALGIYLCTPKTRRSSVQRKAQVGGGWKAAGFIGGMFRIRNRSRRMDEQGQRNDPYSAYEQQRLTVGYQS